MNDIVDAEVVYCGSTHPDGECSLPDGHKGHHENLYARWPADWGWCIGGDQGCAMSGQRPIVRLWTKSGEMVVCHEEVVALVIPQERR